MKQFITVSHSGTGWWLIQRISAVSILVSGGALILGWLWHRPFEYDSWHAAFQSIQTKLFVWLLVASLCLHAWVGLRDVLMDYVKPMAARLGLDVLIVITLSMCVVWTSMILWGING